GEARHSEIMYEDTLPEEEVEDDAMPDYPVTVFYTREGYFKKITPQSLRMSGEQKLKEGDVVTRQIETKNNAELLFFTSACQVYKCRVGDFEDGKASAMGDYIAARLGMDDGEIPLYMALTSDYKGSMLFLFANGKGAKVPLESYATKQNRKKLLNAFSDKAPLAHMEYLQEETELAIETSAGRLLLVGTAQIPAKLTKNTAGVNVITLKKNHTITSVRHADTMELANPHRYRVRTLPAAGAILRAEDLAEQTQLTL
ncbi:MAG: topoisomerase IV, partial [Ruthenibacterium sp.]